MVRALNDWSRILVIAIVLSALSSFLCLPALAAPPRTLIRNAALILTMDPNVGRGDLGSLENADILIEGNKIKEIGQKLNRVGAQVVDATGKIVLPGFVDTHNHLWQSLIRGCATDEDLNGWLAACVFPLFGFNFSAADAYAGVRLSTLDLISTESQQRLIGRMPSRRRLCGAISGPSATRG
jgi:5-methylthioadenosine/S-adenosylhomocysteine deaminase